MNGNLEMATGYRKRSPFNGLRHLMMKYIFYHENQISKFLIRNLMFQWNTSRTSRQKLFIYEKFHWKPSLKSRLTIKISLDGYPSDNYILFNRYNIHLTHNHFERHISELNLITSLSRMMKHIEKYGLFYIGFSMYALLGSFAFLVFR